MEVNLYIVTGEVGVPANNKLFVPANCFYFAGRVPVNIFLFAGTPNILTLVGEKIIFEVWSEILGPPIVSKTYNCLKSDKFNPPRVNYLLGLSRQITSFLKTSKIVENDVLAVTKYSIFLFFI